MTPLDLVSCVYKGFTHGGYIPPSMVGSLISVNKFLTLVQYYPGIPSMVVMDRVSLEQYLSSWASAK